MNKMKRVILFVVEGTSDKDALEPILSELIDTAAVRFEVIRGDATASTEIPFFRKNMKERIKIIVDNFLNNNRGIKKSYIDKIIYVTDTDGCFISDDSIHYSEDDEVFRYEDDGIYTRYVERVEKRNHLKSTNLNILSTSSRIYSLTVETYYFSCNLDHVLYNIRNLDQSLKEEYAINFSDEYEGKEEEFLNFIEQNDFVLSNDYRSSWNEIKKELKSLHRYSNFSVFFKNNTEYLRKEIIQKYADVTEDDRKE